MSQPSDSEILRSSTPANISSMLSPTASTAFSSISPPESSRQKPDFDYIEKELARLAAIVESSDDAIISKNPDGIITTFNRGAERIFGYRAEEIIGQHLSILLPDDRADEFPRIMERLRKGERIDHFETIRRRKDGTLINLSVTISPLHDAQGRLIGASKVARDITWQKQVQKTLRESEERFSRFMAQLPGLAWIKDTEGRYVFVNDAAERAFGKSRAELYGKTDTEIFPAPTARRFRENDHKALESGTGIETVEMLEHTDGLHHSIVSKFPIYGSDGTPTLVGGMAIDITLRVQAEQALKEGEARYRQLVDSLPAAVYTCDAEGRVEIYNQAAATLWGREPKVGEEWWCGSYKIFNPDGSVLPLDQCPMAITLRGGKPVRGKEIVIERPDGTRRNILPHPEPLFDISGKIVGAINMLMDITDIRQMQESLHKELADHKRTEEELFKSNRELEQFAYIASHDLQEPLHMINSFVDLLALRCKGKLEEREREYLNFIKQGSIQAKTLIKELLEYSRIGKSGEHHSVNLHAVLKEVESNLKMSIQESGAELDYGALPMVEAHHLEMAQLFQNLISNAIKYRSQRAPRIRISCELENDMWHFSIEDNGIGIEPQYRERIFGMFQRLHANSKYSGTGIGLAVCKKIVESHGGKIWVESEPGQGSTFHFTLNADPKPVGMA